MDEAEADTAPEEKPAAVVVSDPWAEGASGDGEPKPSVLADTGMRTADASRRSREAAKPEGGEGAQQGTRRHERHE